MNTSFLKVLLWFLLSLPVLLAAFILFVKVIREELSAEKINNINDDD